MRRIAHLSDLHYGADPVAQPRLYEGLIALFASQQIDAIVFTGDVFDTNEAKPGMVEGFMRLHAGIEAQLGGPRPTIILPGNHDRRGDGVFSPYREELFSELASKFSERPEVKVLGAHTPFLAQRVPLPDFPCDVVAYDSAYLPSGIASAGGVIRQEDLLQVGSQLALGDPERPLLFLLHHHLIPTPVTDTSVINTSGRPPIQKFLVSKVLPWLVSNGDREELTMTALGAGSALSTLATLGRAVIVLHGHKHYATARLLKGLDGDADLLITSAGSCGMTQDWTGGEYEQAPKLWPSVNFIQLDSAKVQVTSQAWSPFQPERRSSTRNLVSATRDGRQWTLELPPLREAQFHPVLTMNELDAQLVPSKSHLGRLDVVTKRTLASHPRAWLQEYWEVLEGPSGAVARDLRIHGGANWKDAKCPARVKLAKDGVSTWRIEGGVFSDIASAEAQHQGKAFESVELLNRSRADVARLRVHLGPVKTTPFASITNLTTGKERPYPFTREGDVVTVTRNNCPARTLLRLYWPLER
jgi:3',5'-cyclic AMP phosphodiesterase CpdA